MGKHFRASQWMSQKSSGFPYGAQGIAVMIFVIVIIIIVINALKYHHSIYPYGAQGIVIILWAILIMICAIVIMIINAIIIVIAGVAVIINIKKAKNEKKKFMKTPSLSDSLSTLQRFFFLKILRLKYKFNLSSFWVTSSLFLTKYWFLQDG